MARLCRLCWKVINDHNFEIIEEIRKEMLEVLLLKLDLSWSEENIICSHCIEQLETSFQFKATCLYTEDHIFPLIKQNNKIDMRQIYNDNEQMIVINFAADMDVCRLCMGIFENDSFNTLEAMNRDMLQKYLPEVNLSVAQRTLLCKGCLKSLTCYFNFARICMERYKKMRAFFKNTSITSNCYVQLSRIKLPTDDNTNKLPRVKVEDFQNVEVECNTENGVKLNVTTRKVKDYESQDNKLLQLKQTKKIYQMKWTGGKRMFFCEICAGSYRYKHRLISHKSIVHGKGCPAKLYKCDQCSFITKYKSCLVRHGLVHKSLSKIKMYTCPNCQFRTKYKYDLQKHLRLSTRCKYKFRHPELTHENKSKLPTYNCYHCTYETNSRTCIIKHLMAHRRESDLVNFDCPQCPYKTMHEENLTNHMNAHKTVPYKCNTCGFTATNKFSLSRHDLLAHKVGSGIHLYYCDKCTFVTRYSISIKRHHMFMHMDSSQLKMYKCKVCPYQSKFKDSLVRHSVIHQEHPQWYTCRYCSYKTIQKHYFKRHLRVHDKNKIKKNKKN